jgi:hypothetical protein
VRRPYAVHWKAPTPPPGDLYYEYVVNTLTRNHTYSPIF